MQNNWRSQEISTHAIQLIYRPYLNVASFSVDVLSLFQDLTLYPTWHSSPSFCDSFSVFLCLSWPWHFWSILAMLFCMLSFSWVFSFFDWIEVMHCWPENHKSVFFWAHHTQGLRDVDTSSLQMLTSISWSEWCLIGLYTIKLLLLCV